VDVTNNEAIIAAAEKGRGLVHMMRIAVTRLMGQVATGEAEWSRASCATTANLRSRSP
jgi:hypothetical protein